jgi:hypothetical protein
MMHELLAHPATQAAVAPFIVALVIALLFRRLGAVALGLAIIGGLLTTVTLTTGLALQPLTSTRKIILSSLCLPFVVLLVDMLMGRAPLAGGRLRGIIRIVLPTALLIGVVNWVIWPVLLRQEILDGWIVSARVSLYVGVISAFLLGLTGLNRPGKSAAEGASIFALGLGTAITSMIAASALYSQLAFSVVAAVGALLLVGLFTKPFVGSKEDAGYLGQFALFAAVVPLTLIGGAATVYTQLPVWVLFWLATVPLIAGIITIKAQRPILRLLFTSLLALLPVIPAIWLAWQAAAPMDF